MSTFPPQYVWIMDPFGSAYDATINLQRHQLEVGAPNTMLVTAFASGAAYLVFRRIAGGAVYVPPGPWQFTVKASKAEADAAYAEHATAPARGIVSTYNGEWIVYWTA